MNQIASHGANSLRSGPDGRGRFGEFGGRFVAETLMPLVLDVERAWEAAKADPAYAAEVSRLATYYVGRPSPMWFAERLTRQFGGAKIYFKREELNHTGSHKINNCVALECAHALAAVEKVARAMRPDQIVLMNLSGRGDKDIFTVAEHLGVVM